MGPVVVLALCCEALPATLLSAGNCSSLYVLTRLNQQRFEVRSSHVCSSCSTIQCPQTPPPYTACCSWAKCNLTQAVANS